MASNPPERMKLHRGAVHSAMHEYIYFFHFTNFILKFRYAEKATKFEKNLPLKIWRYYFSNIVALSEYPNFMYMQKGFDPIVGLACKFATMRNEWNGNMHYVFAP